MNIHVADHIFMSIFDVMIFHDFKYARLDLCYFINLHYAKIKLFQDSCKCVHLYQLY